MNDEEAFTENKAADEGGGGDSSIQACRPLPSPAHFSSFCLHFGCGALNPEPP